MARAGIYKSEVVRARNNLLAMGRYPSIDAIRGELGNTGSKGTIHRYLKEIEEEEGGGTGPQGAVMGMKCIGNVTRRGGGEEKGAEGKIKAPTPFGRQVIVCTSFSVVSSACRGLGTSVGRAPGGRFACLRAALLVGGRLFGHYGGESGLHRILKHGR